MYTKDIHHNKSTGYDYMQTFENIRHECLVDSLNRDRYLIQHDLNFAAGDLTVLKLMWCYIGLCKGNQFQLHLFSPAILYCRIKIEMHQLAFRISALTSMITARLAFMTEYRIRYSGSGRTRIIFSRLSPWPFSQRLWLQKWSHRWRK